MPKSLADGRKKVVILAAKPADPSAITVTELTAATPAVQDASCNILASDYDLGPTGSDRLAEKPLCVKGKAEVFTESNYGGGFTVFREFDTTTKQPHATDDWLWALVKDKGNTIHIVERMSAKDADEDFEALDEYSYYEVITDDPSSATMEGYIKHRVNLAVQTAQLHKVVAAGA